MGTRRDDHPTEGSLFTFSPCHFHPEPDDRARSARVVQYWSVTCLWVGIVDGQFRVMHQRPYVLRCLAHDGGLQSYDDVTFHVTR